MDSSHLPDLPAHRGVSALLERDQDGRLIYQDRHHGVQPDLSETPDAMPLQAAALLQALEYPLYGLAQPVEHLPLRTPPADRPEQTDVRRRVLPDL